MRAFVSAALLIAWPLAASAGPAKSATDGAHAAEPAAGEPAASGDEDDELARARAIFEKGRARYELGAYEDAIELWTESYELVLQHPEATRILADISFNVMQAQRRAFEVDRDLRRLRRALQLAEQCVAIYESAATDSPELAELRTQIEEIEAEIREAEAAEAAQEAEAGASPTNAGPGSDAGKPARPLMIAGASALSVGVAGLGVLGAGMALGSGAQRRISDPETPLADRRAAFDRGYAANTVAIAGAVVAGVGLATGAALLVLGTRRKAGAESRAQARLETSVSGLEVRF